MDPTKLIPFSLTPQEPINETRANFLTKKILYVTGEIVCQILNIQGQGALIFNSKADIKIGDWVGISFNYNPCFGFLAQLVSPDCYRIDPVAPCFETLFIPSSLIRVQGKFMNAVEMMNFEDVQIPSAN